MGVMVYASVDGIGMMGQSAESAWKAAEAVRAAASRGRRYCPSQYYADRMDEWIDALCLRMVTDGAEAMKRGKYWASSTGQATVALSPCRNPEC